MKLIQSGCACIRRRQRWGLIVTCLCLAVCVAGCPSTPATSGTGSGATDGETDNSTSDGQFQAEIVNVQSTQPVSLLVPFISVLYSVTNVPAGTTISAFYVPVSGTGADAVETGDRIPLVNATNLAAGSDQAFNFVPAEAGEGTFKVGLTVSQPTGVVTTIFSTGVISIQGPPEPFFILPPDHVTEIEQGDTLTIKFDAGDSEGQAWWRLFYVTASDPLGSLPDEPVQDLGEQITVGVGNAGIFEWGTAGLLPGRYEIGVSATDSGESIAATALRGDEDLITTIPNESTDLEDRRVIVVTEATDPVPPSVTFLAPGASDVQLFGNEAFTVQLEVTLASSGLAFMDVFHDTDTDPSNGFQLLAGATNVPTSATTFSFPTNLSEGTYHIGVTVRQGALSPVTVYAAGAVNVVRTPSLVVTAPTTSVPIKPTGSSEGNDSVTVTWTTNVPPTAGTVDVFAQTVDAFDVPFGAEIPVLGPSSTTVTSVEFTSEASGSFRITVRISLNDSSIPDLLVPAPAIVRVSSAPVILWLGSLAEETPAFDGAVFQGVNFEDNAGTSFSQVGDLNGDGTGEFLISARYGKPFFTNQSGVGSGEAYLIFGSPSLLKGSFNLNSVGTTGLPGVTLTGVRAPQNISDSTDGLSSVSRIPDVDGDSRDELVFGFPFVRSRGHNASPLQDGVIDPRALQTLEREDQFRRGGVVIVSSRNSAFASPSTDNTVVNLDTVGQLFGQFTENEFCVEPEPDSILPDGLGDFATNVHSDVADDGTGCTGDCDDPSSGGKPDATEYIDYGFVSALARDYFSTYIYSWQFFFGADSCETTEDFLNHECLEQLDVPIPHEFCTPFVSSCEPFSPGLHALVLDPDGFFDPVLGFPTTTRHSGFYFFYEEIDDVMVENTPKEPLGARIIGVGLSDKFGTTLTLSNASGTGAGDIIVTAPARTARGILLGPEGGPEAGGEINGLESSPGTAAVNTDSGVAYLFGLRSLWTRDGFLVPPKPHQYIVGEASHCGGPFPLTDDGVTLAGGLIDNIEAIRIAGFAGDHIANIVGLDDFNGDGLNDFAIGAPTANGGQGRVYVAFRRSAGLEGDFVLEKLALDPSDPQRLSGVLLITDGIGDALGSSLVSGVDFNRDGQSDLVIGSPGANGGQGEIIVVFGDPNLVSPLNGITVEDLLNSVDADDNPRAARIQGNPLDTNGQFGFNVANAGDIDGDGLNDLLVAAPGATPRFDPDPSDDVDAFTEVGIDTNLDGENDFGAPDVAEAGLVYVIFGNSALDEIPVAEGRTINIDQLGGNILRGFLIAGRHAGDRIGGGDAGNVGEGGISTKEGRGRSSGLASAGDVDGDGRADILIGSILADPRKDPGTGTGVENAGEAYLIYGSVAP